MNSMRIVCVLSGIHTPGYIPPVVYVYTVSGGVYTVYANRTEVTRNLLLEVEIGND